jgi:VCBS repeat-containing protein
MKRLVHILYSFSLLILLVSSGCKPLGEAEINVNFAANAETGSPVAANGALAVLEDTLRAGTLVASNPAKVALTYSIVSNPANGVVIITNDATGAYTYEPNLGYVGSDSFTFRVNDGSVDSNIATISVTVNEVNEIPVASAGVLAIDEDSLGAGTLVATDADGEPLTYEIVANATNGIVTITDSATGAYTYQPNGNLNGADSFTFRATDGSANSNTATISITVNPLNDVPVADAGALAINEDSLGAGILVANDVDGNALTYSIVANPSNGVVIITNAATGSYTYQPNADFSGTDSFTFRVHDGTVYSNTATITITVSGVSDAPVAVDGTLKTKVDVTGNGTLSASDADGEAMTYSIVSNAANGAVTITDPSTGAYSYVPNPGYSGADSFTFKVNDGSGDSNTATILITVSLVADMYFCPDVVADYSWNNAANWYLDSGCTVGNEANRIPIDGDSVFIFGNSFTDQPSAVELASFEGNLSTNQNSESVNISIAPGGTLRVTDGHWYGITDSAAIAEFTCNNQCSNRSILNGDATFNLIANNSGYAGAMINGNAYFNDSSLTDGGIISGDVTFNGNTWMYGGEIQGITTFNDSSRLAPVFYITFNHVVFNSADTFDYLGTYPYSPGAVTFVGDVTFNNSSVLNPLGIYSGNVDFPNGATITIDGYEWALDTSAWTGTIAWVFINNGYNSSTIKGNASYSGSPAYPLGDIDGNAEFDIGGCTGGSNVTGNITLYNNSCYGGGTVSGNAYLYGTSSLTDITVNGDAIFNDSSGVNSSDVIHTQYFSTILGSSTFNGTSYYRDQVDATFVGNVNFPNGATIVVDANRWDLDASTWTGTLTWIFQNNSYLAPSGVLPGIAGFFDTSYSQGHIAEVSFNDTSYNDGGTYGICIGNDAIEDGIGCNP